MQEMELCMILILDGMKQNAPDNRKVAFLIKCQILSLPATVKNMIK